MDIAVGDRRGAATGGAAGFDVTLVVADEQRLLRLYADLLASQQQHVRCGFAVLDMIRADQHGRALGQIQALHDRLGVAHRLVGGHAPWQARLLDVGEQRFDAVEGASQYRAMRLVALEKLLAQGFEGGRVRGFIECAGDHGARAARHLIANGLVCQWRQAAGSAHGLGNGDEIRRRVEQGAIHVEKNCFQTHASHSLRSVWIM